MSSEEIRGCLGEKSKLINGQYRPPVRHVTLFGPKEVSLGLRETHYIFWTKGDQFGPLLGQVTFFGLKEVSLGSP